MPVDDPTINLRRKLTEVLGPDDADTLMTRLPPFARHDIATKSDLDEAVDRLRTQLRTEMHSVGSDLGSEMQIGFAELRIEFIEATNRQIKWLVTFAAAWTSLLVTLVRFIP